MPIFKRDDVELYYEEHGAVNVSREFVAQCQTPLLVLLGNDLHHPAETSRELAALAPNATLIEHWKEPEHQPAAQQAVERFLAAHTPR